MPHVPNRAALLLAPATLAIVVACASPGTDEAAGAQRETRACFLPSQVNGFTPIDRQTVDVRVSANRVFRLELLGTCTNIDWAQRIGIRSRGGGSWICQGLDAEIISPEPGGPQTCPVSSVRQLSPEEIEAARQARRRN